MEMKLLHFVLVVFVAIVADMVLSYMDREVEHVVSNDGNGTIMSDHQEREL